MSQILGKNYLATFIETEVECPICTFAFDCSEKSEKAKYPLFKMKCPACKSLLGIYLPIFGGDTECFEWIGENNGNRLTFKTDYRLIIEKPIIIEKDDDFDDDDLEEVEMIE